MSLVNFSILSFFLFSYSTGRDLLLGHVLNVLNTSSERSWFVASFGSTSIAQRANFISFDWTNLGKYLAAADLHVNRLKYCLEALVLTTQPSSFVCVLGPSEMNCHALEVHSFFGCAVRCLTVSIFNNLRTIQPTTSPIESAGVQEVW